MFDAYEEWLGIPKDQRPPTFYQLLGIARSESDPDVIAAAAIERMAVVRKHLGGPHKQDCTLLLNKFALARYTLLDAARRADYDETLPPDAACDATIPPDTAPRDAQYNDAVNPSIVVAKTQPDGGKSKDRGVLLRFLPVAAGVSALTVAILFIVRMERPGASPAPAPTATKATAKRTATTPTTVTTVTLIEPAVLQIAIDPPDARLTVRDVSGRWIVKEGARRVYEFPADGRSPLRLVASGAGFETVRRRLVVQPGERRSLSIALRPDGPDDTAPADTTPAEAAEEPPPTPSRTKSGVKVVTSERLKFEGDKSPIRGLSVSPDGTRAVSAADDGRIRVYEVKTGKMPFWFKAHSGPALSVMMSDDGRFAATGGAEGVVSIWNLRNGVAVRHFAGMSGAVSCVAFAPEETVVAIDATRTVRRWGRETGIETAHSSGTVPTPTQSSRSEAAPSGVPALAVAPDGMILATCGGPTPLILRMRFFPLRKQLRTSGGPVIAIDVAPDGRTLLLGCDDGKVLLWDLKRDEPIRELAGHTGPVTSVAFDRKGQRAVTASGDDDCSIRLWDLKTGVEIRRFIGHEDAVSRAVFLPDGSRILSASLDESVRLWEWSE